jgi:hypothetical protein
VTVLPERILTNWREWFGARADEMAAEVAARAEAAVRAWDLDDPRVLPGGEVALVLAAERRGRAVVCKLNPHDPALGHEARGLAAWTGLCPELLGTRDDEDTILMERLDPGLPLAGNAGSVEGELRVIAGIARRLHATTRQPQVELLAESVLAAEWMDALEDADDRAELRRLLEAGREVVIHTDLHAQNVLSHEDGWRMIDPKPFRAPREAEVWALVDGTGLPEEPAAAGREMGRRLALYCEAAGLESGPALSWARLRAEAEKTLAPRASSWRAELTSAAAALGAVS